VKRIHAIIPAATIALLLGGCITPPLPPHLPKVDHRVDTGPFWWGISSSSFQNEDRAEAPGSPNYFETDWDLFAKAKRVPPKHDEPYGWTEFDKDVAALKHIGVNHYRFGIEWARVEPKPGVYNEAAIRHYVEMARKLKAAGIEPVVTLWHFTFPDWLVTPGDPGKSRWLHPDMLEHWGPYVERMTKAMSPYVRVWAPQNEANGDLSLGYLSATWPPGLFLNFPAYSAAMRRSVTAFREAADIIHRSRKDALVMSIAALPYWIPTIFDPTGAYFNGMQQVNFRHLDQVADVCDLIGFNYYYTEYPDFTVLLALKLRQGRNFSLLGWIIQPRSLYKQIRAVCKRYRKPVVVTENGIATKRDLQRVRYLFNHMLEVKEALHDGLDVRGYFVWTLTDNYEWHHGYKAPFGLSSYDPQTGQLKLRPSALFYRGIIDASKDESLLMDDVPMPVGLHLPKVPKMPGTLHLHHPTEPGQ